MNRQIELLNSGAREAADILNCENGISMEDLNCALINALRRIQHLEDAMKREVGKHAKNCGISNPAIDACTCGKA